MRSTEDPCDGNHITCYDYALYELTLTFLIEIQRNLVVWQSAVNLIYRVFHGLYLYVCCLTVLQQLPAVFMVAFSMCIISILIPDGNYVSLYCSVYTVYVID